MRRPAVLATLAVAVAAVTAAAPRRPDPTHHGEWVMIARGGDSIRAYVAYPERKDRAPAVIVIHEIFGLTEWEPTVGDRFAQNGYVAIVPDLLSSKHGRSPATPDSGRKLMAALEADRVTADLDAVYAYVNGLPAVRKEQVATIGFCWGGGQSFRYATNNPKLKAAIICYGPAPDSTALPRINAKLLGIYGENDARINAVLPDVAARLSALKKSFAYDIYPETGHGFLKPGRKGADGPQPDRAWAKAFAFLKEAIGS
ncbi:MAG: dienelactone hydrolase family protein [Gemmatimonadales bacterium]|nr:dienelactone hydrolase family protein [Gemmatimonadales bacterium]